MKIYTRTGDGGQTFLPSGQRTAKDDLRIQGYGSLDELASLLGWVASQPGLPDRFREQLAQLTVMAMEAGGAVATGQGERPAGLPGSEGDLEAWMDALDAELPPLASFILPMGCPAAGACHVARSSCRRIERVLVGIQRQAPYPAWVGSWVNRLADYLFVLARALNHEAGGGDAPWRRQGR